MPFVVTESCINSKHTFCVEACAVDAFHEGPNFLVINPDVCIDCARCKSACLLGAIVSTRKISKDQRRFIQLNAEMALVWPKITEKKSPPPDSEEWDGVMDKFKLLEL